MVKTITDIASTPTAERVLSIMIWKGVSFIQAIRILCVNYKEIHSSYYKFADDSILHLPMNTLHANTYNSYQEYVSIAETGK